MGTLKVIAGPTVPGPPWDAKGKLNLGRAEGNYNHHCGTCDFVVFRDQFWPEMKGNGTVKCPVCGSTLEA